MKKIFAILVTVLMSLTIYGQKTQYYDLIIQKSTPLLHLYGSGGIINWNNGDLLLTHTSNTLTLTGGDLLLSSTYSLGIGATTPLHKLVVAGAGANNRNIFNFVNTDLNKNRTSTTQSRDTSSLNMWFSGGGSPLLTMMDKNGNVLFRADSIGFGIGTATPLTKLSVLTAQNTSLYAFNFVQSSINKRRDTFGQGSDTSSLSLAFSYTGSPALNLTNKAGINLLSVDSVKITTPNEIVLTGNDVLTLSGNATVWEDLMFPFQTGQSGGGLYPPYVADSSYFAFVVDSTGGTKCFMYFIVQMPHNMKIGSTIYPHVHYKQEDATTDTPIFIMKYKWYDLMGTTQKGFKWYRMSTSTGTTDKTHQLMYNASGGIPGTGITSVSSILVCEIYLYALAAGNAACNAYQFDIHYEIDGLGSRTDLAK